MKKEYISPAITVVNAETEPLLENSNPRIAVRINDMTTQDNFLQVGDTKFTTPDSSNPQLTISTGSGRPNAKDNSMFGDLWDY